jgi:hypothetical protein
VYERERERERERESERREEKREKKREKVSYTGFFNCGTFLSINKVFSLFDYINQSTIVQQVERS